MDQSRTSPSHAEEEMEFDSELPTYEHIEECEVFWGFAEGSGSFQKPAGIFSEVVNEDDCRTGNAQGLAEEEISTPSRAMSPAADADADDDYTPSRDHIKLHTGSMAARRRAPRSSLDAGFRTKAQSLYDNHTLGVAVVRAIKSPSKADDDASSPPDRLARGTPTRSVRRLRGTVFTAFEQDITRQAAATTAMGSDEVEDGNRKSAFSGDDVDHQLPVELSNPLLKIAHGTFEAASEFTEANQEDVKNMLKECAASSVDTEIQSELARWEAERSTLIQRLGALKGKLYPSPERDAILRQMNAVEKHITSPIITRRHSTTGLVVDFQTEITPEKMQGISPKDGMPLSATATLPSNFRSRVPKHGDFDQTSPFSEVEVKQDFYAEDYSTVSKDLEELSEIDLIDPYACTLKLTSQTHKDKDATTMCKSFREQYTLAQLDSEYSVLDESSLTEDAEQSTTPPIDVAIKLCEMDEYSSKLKEISGRNRTEKSASPQLDNAIAVALSSLDLESIISKGKQAVIDLQAILSMWRKGAGEATAISFNKPLTADEILKKLLVYLAVLAANDAGDTTIGKSSSVLDLLISAHVDWLAKNLGPEHTHDCLYHAASYLDRAIWADWPGTNVANPAALDQVTSGVTILQALLAHLEQNGVDETTALEHYPMLTDDLRELMRRFENIELLYLSNDASDHEHDKSGLVQEAAAFANYFKELAAEVNNDLDRIIKGMTLSHVLEKCGENRTCVDDFEIERPLKHGEATELVDTSTKEELSLESIKTEDEGKNYHDEEDGMERLRSRSTSQQP
jgi:hypothetical protein